MAELAGPALLGCSERANGAAVKRLETTAVGAVPPTVGKPTEAEPLGFGVGSESAVARVVEPGSVSSSIATTMLPDKSVAAISSAPAVKQCVAFSMLLSPSMVDLDCFGLLVSEPLGLWSS